MADVGWMVGQGGFVGVSVVDMRVGDGIGDLGIGSLG
jgi:hypothetical protein